MVHSRILKAASFLFIYTISLPSCNISEPEEFYSPTAGFLTVNLKSDNTDTNINILGTDYGISDQDSMDLLVFQGKVFDADSNFAILFHNIKSWRQE